MKIRSLLLVGLLAGQAMPSLAMTTDLFNSIKSSFAQANQSLKTVADFATKHPILTTGVVFTAVTCGVIADPYRRIIWMSIADRVMYRINCMLDRVPLNDRLREAAICGDLSEAEYVLKRGAQPDSSERIHQPLAYAITFKHYPMVDLLLKYGARVQDGCLYEVLNGGFNGLEKRVARRLIEAGANPDALIPDRTKTVRQFAQAQAATTGNQDYINVFKPESKLL